VAAALAAWAIPRIHLYPGGTIAPTLNAWIARGGAYVVARHEQGAGYAALAEARLSGEPRAVLVTSGPGVTNLVTVVADAWYDSVPLLALAGQVGTADLRSRPHVRQRGFQEVPASRLLEPVTKACFRPMTAAELPEVLDAALRAATSGRPGPVLVELPMDVQRATVETAAPAQDPPRPTGRSHGAPAPDPALLDELAEWIAEAEQPVVLAGHGVLQARAIGALRALAEGFSLPVTTSLPAVGAFPGDHPLSLGFLGHTGTGWANRAVHDCDLLLVLGARLDVRQTGTRTDCFAREGRVARVDLDAHELAESRVRADLTLHADAGAVLAALGERLSGRVPPPREAWLAAIKDWREALPLDAYPAGAGCHPARLLRALDAATRDRPLVAVTGVGHHQQWAARHMTFDWPERVLLTSSGHGAMGYDLPAAAGAAFARPDARVLCVVGDGSFQLNMQELGTLAEYGLPVKIAVLDNRRLAMVSQFQNLTWGSDPSTGDRAAVDFAGLARCYGFETFALDSLDADAEAVIERFLGAPGPALLRARIDPACEVSPMLLAGQTLDGMWTWKP
jgi:acetolactate synthase-1/2/3 large subunit